MKDQFLEWFASLREVLCQEHSKFARRIWQIGFVLTLCLTGLASAAAQSPPDAPPNPDAQRCAALTEFNLEVAPGGPAVITSAHVVEVPTSGLARWTLTPSGYASSAPNSSSLIHRYCEVSGYVAPPSKFELKLPLSGDWNQKFFFYACGAFCGTVFGDACNLGLTRGYASATGNGGHDSAWGFDGVWAANAPELQEDFGWRSNHVVTLIAKAITTHFYGKPIRYSYMGALDEVLDIVQKNRDLLQELVQICYESLSEAYDQLNTLAFRDTVHRLVRVLLRLGAQLGHSSGQKTELSTYLTQEEISQMVVARRERVSTAMNFLRNRGMLDYSHRGYLVLNLKALQNYTD